ncbi:hypothetical protein [Paraburkholderia nodosa]|uniref:hypothetical protein n=1 Tax=Paraburkholderia nodosa TaxID=392320 RepID=UPI0009F63B21|nr:hypothetical protein [Paraburkholderia nodosa]
MDETIELIERAAALGVGFRLDGERLHMTGPKDARDLIRDEATERRSELIAYLRANGGATEPDGGLSLPWGPYLDADDVRELRTELRAAIEALCELENWPDALLVDVMTRAMRGPLSDLLPNVHHFHQRLDAVKAETAVRAVLTERTWRYDQGLR